MNNKGQGALEYLLLIGGAVLVAAVVLSLVTNLTDLGKSTTEARNIDALCAPIPENRCGVAPPTGVDPDGESATYDYTNCTWDTTLTRCVPVG